MRTLSQLSAISPIDGRYRSQCEPLSSYFSEAAIIRYRIRVETAYLVALSRIPLPGHRPISEDGEKILDSLWQNFGVKEAEKVKDIEKRINHDVKAIEYYIREAIEGTQLEPWTEFVHFGLTSQDINNTAFPMALKDGWIHVLMPLLLKLVRRIEDLSCEWSHIPMLARTHGQPASPTILGKELFVFAERLTKQLDLLQDFEFSGKFGGATGNLNAHHVAYPEIDWAAFADTFVKEVLGLKRQRTTTQIEHYDGLAQFYDIIRRINTILIDLCRDMWAYISMDYFKQKIKADEVGSSAMPHKVNPIDFENAEGNLGLANAIAMHLAEKLPISRLQRDLTDSTVLRNIGVPLAHMLIALNSISKGLDKIILNPGKLKTDLEENWAVLAEAIQTILRREGVQDPYGKLKLLTRTQERIDKKSLHDFIESLDVSENLKKELQALTPDTYTGLHPWRDKPER